MRVSGRRGHTREVPGTCNIGKIGVTFGYPQVRGELPDRGAACLGDRPTSLGRVFGRLVCVTCVYPDARDRIHTHYVRTPTAFFSNDTDQQRASCL